MPAYKSDDPLIPLPVRFPSSFVARLRSAAEQQNVTLSDMLRTHLAADSVKPLGKPVPQRRRQNLAPPSKADPELLRQLASIESNVNQIAHQVNSSELAGATIDTVRVLAELQQIERHLQALADHAVS